MRCVVVESPYSNRNGYSIEHNVEYARRCVKDCLERGESPIASHLLLTQPGILDDAIPIQRMAGMAAGHEWIKHCDAVVLYLDYGLTSGMKKGKLMADYYDKPIEERYLDRQPEQPVETTRD